MGQNDRVHCRYNAVGSTSARTTKTTWWHTLAAYILLDTRRRGLLRPDTIIVECTSGNTGIALAMVGAALGRRVRILMTDTASVERRHLMRHFCAELLLFEATHGYAIGIDMAERMAADAPRIFLPRQFSNELNARNHSEHTAREILAQLPGWIDAFVSGYGTGGTLNRTAMQRTRDKIGPDGKPLVASR